jgi:hypothetical protein
VVPLNGCTSDNPNIQRTIVIGTGAALFGISKNRLNLWSFGFFFSSRPLELMRPPPTATFDEEQLRELCTADGRQHLIEQSAVSRNGVVGVGEVVWSECVRRLATLGAVC